MAATAARVRRLDCWSSFYETNRPNKVHGVHLCTKASRGLSRYVSLTLVCVATSLCLAFAQGSRAMHSTSGEPWQPVLANSTLAQNWLRLTIPCWARSSYLWQAAQSSLPATSQPAPPGHILLDIPKGCDFLPPPRPCVCRQPVYHLGLVATRSLGCRGSSFDLETMD